MRSPCFLFLCFLQFSDMPMLPWSDGTVHSNYSTTNFSSHEVRAPHMIDQSLNDWEFAREFAQSQLCLSGRQDRCNANVSVYIQEIPMKLHSLCYICQRLQVPRFDHNPGTGSNN